MGLSALFLMEAEMCMRLFLSLAHVLRLDALSTSHTSISRKFSGIP